MILLDTTTRSLEVDLTGAVATNQLPFVASYVNVSQSTFAMSAASTNTGATNNTTAVTLVAAPGATTTRQLKYLSIKNSDTAAVELWVQMNDNSTLREIWKGTLAVGDTLFYVDGAGWNVLNSSGQIKNGGAATFTATRVPFADSGGNLTSDSGFTFNTTGDILTVGALNITGSTAASWYLPSADNLRTPHSVTIDDNLTVSSAGPHVFGNQTGLRVTLNGTAANRNWQFGVDDPTSGAFTLTPSTANGGTTFTTPVLSIVGSTGAVTLAGTLTVSGSGGAIVSGAGPSVFGHTASVGARLGEILETNTSSNYGGVALNTWSATGGEHTLIDINRSKSATKGTFTAVVSGDNIGSFIFRGADGTGFVNTALIQVQVDGTVGTNQVPGKFIIQTANSSGTMTNAILISSAQALTLPGHASGTPTFTAGDKYLVVDASGNIHVSALGPAS